MTTPGLPALPTPQEVLEVLRGLLPVAPKAIRTQVIRVQLPTYVYTTGQINPKLAGDARNTGTADLEVKTRITAYSNGVVLRSAESAPFTLLAGEILPVTSGPVAVYDTDLPGDVTAKAELVKVADGKALDQKVSVVLATIQPVPAVALNGGFASERQVRYVGGIEGAGREVYMVLTAYVQPSDPGPLTMLREVKSGAFMMPVGLVPQVVVPVYDSDPAGLLAGGLKLFDAPSGALLTTDYGPERIQNGLWALNAGQVALWPTGATPTGQAQNYYGSVAYRINNLILANTGDVAMTVRVRSWVSAIQGITNMNFGEIPGFTHQQDVTVPAGGSVTLSIARGPAEAPQPYYDWIAYGNYVRLEFSLAAVSGGFASYSRSWDIGQNTGIFF